MKVIDGCSREVVPDCGRGCAPRPSRLSLLPVDGRPDEEEPDDDTWNRDQVDAGTAPDVPRSPRLGRCRFPPASPWPDCPSRPRHSRLRCRRRAATQCHGHPEVLAHADERVRRCDVLPAGRRRTHAVDRCSSMESAGRSLTAANRPAA